MIRRMLLFCFHSNDFFLFKVIDRQQRYSEDLPNIPEGTPKIIEDYPKNPWLLQSTSDNSKLQGKLKNKGSSHREFELSRVKLYRKWPEGKGKLVRVSARFELARVRVIGSRLYTQSWFISNRKYSEETTKIFQRLTSLRRVCLLWWLISGSRYSEYSPKILAELIFLDWQTEHCPKMAEFLTQTLWWVSVCSEIHQWRHCLVIASE